MILNAKHFIAVAALVAVAGCGGGGGGSDTQSGSTSAGSAAQGLWTGSADTGRSVTGLVLGDGTYYFLYSRAGNPNVLAGVVQGTGATGTDTFSSGDTRDFNFEEYGVLPAAVSATYVAKQSFAGTVAYEGGNTISFSTAYDSDYDATPSLDALAGTYSGQATVSFATRTATMTVAPSGAISGSTSGCTFSGTATARSDGNAYDLSATFSGASCQFANQTLTGVAYYSAAGKRLYAATPNASRTNGFFFAGVKP